MVSVYQGLNTIAQLKPKASYGINFCPSSLALLSVCLPACLSLFLSLICVTVCGVWYMYWFMHICMDRQYCIGIYRNHRRMLNFFHLAF